MIRITQHRFCSAILGGLLSFSLPLSVQASPLFDGSNNDLWVISPATGRVMGFDFNDWLLSFASGNGPLYQLQSGEQALINTLAQSSIPLTAGQPAISIAGLDAGADGSGSPGFDRLAVEPASGQFENTLAITLKVNTDQLSSTPLVLRWNLSGGTGSGQVVLTDDGLTGKLPPGGSLAEGSYVQTVYIAKPGQYTLQAQLAINNQPIAEQSRNYEIASNDPDWHRRDVDNDGIPDFIEAAIGLNPFTDDWQFDADGDGWSEFDSWLRTYCLGAGLVVDRQTECLDAEGRPLDTDGDGWSDFDEKVRGTNPEDQQPQLLPEDNESIDSSAFLARIQRFKDFPVAGRLYEVERLLDGRLPEVAVENLSWSVLYAQSVFGQRLYDSAALLANEAITAAGVTPSKLPSRLREEAAKTDLIADLIPAIRLPAGNSVILAAHQRSIRDKNASEPEYLRIYKHWLTASPDLSPRSFLDSLLNNNAPAITDVETWQTDFIRYLGENLVINGSGQVINVSGTVAVSLFETALSSEASIIASPQLQLFSGFASDINSDLITESLAGLRRFRQSNYRFDDLYATLQLAATDTFSDLASWVQGHLLAGAEHSRSDQFVAQQFGLDPVRRYQARLLLLPDVIAQVGNDSSILNPDGDSDSDTLSNRSEIQSALSLLTLPWILDTDGDGIHDGADICPADPLDKCSLSPALPAVRIEHQVVISEPSEDERLALVGVTLDRVAEQDILISFRAEMGAGVATPGTDFEPIIGQIMIHKGDRSGVISIPVFADSASENQENFFIEITSVDGAVLLGDTRTQITIINVDNANTLIATLAESLINATSGDNIFLDASTSIDPAGGTLSFSWRQVDTSGVPLVLNAPSGSTLQFQAPDLRSSITFEVEVSISNAAGATASAIALVAVEPPLIPATLHGRLPATPGGTDYQAYYDEDLDITWLANANVAGEMTWEAANIWAEELDVNGVKGWRLPVLSPVNGSSFNLNFSNNGTTDNATAISSTDGLDGGWRDPQADSVSELGHLFYVTLGNTGGCRPNGSGSPASCDRPSSFGFTRTGPFSHIQTSATYWSGTELSGLESWGFENSEGRQIHTIKTESRFAWAVHSGDVIENPSVLCDLPPVAVGGRCVNEVVARSVADIDAYITSNFGRKTGANGKAVFKSLRLIGSIGNLTQPLVVTSPCSIVVNAKSILSGSEIGLHARQGLSVNWSADIASSGEVCLIADKQNVFLNGGHSIAAKSLAIRADKKAFIGFRSTLTVNGEVELSSTGRSSLGQVKVGNKTKITARNFTMQAENTAELAFQAEVSTTAEIRINSGSRPTSKTLLSNRSSIQAGTAIELGSLGETRIGFHATVAAGDNLDVNAKTDGDCSVANISSITYSSKTGNCAGKLP